MQITINGQPYPDWVSIPVEYRTKLAASQPDSNGSGIPDAFEGDGEVRATIDGDTVSLSGSRSSATSASSTAVTVGGQNVRGWFKRLFGR